MTPKREVTAERRNKMIAEAAYYRSLERGFTGGDPVADWLDAERIIDAELAPHDKKLALRYERLSEVNAKLHEVASKLKAEAGEEWHKEIKRIQKFRDDFSIKLEEMRAATGEAKEKAKSEADKLWHEIVKGIKRMGDYPE